MIPILGETVLAIIHGPATTSHIAEISDFLRRPIDLWANKGRVLLFGRCHARPRLTRLNLAYEDNKNDDSPVGHFTLVPHGREPPHVDPEAAGKHPKNCGFDVVADQTGYPASALRQIAAQRMLAKLYESRLRGRDYHFQCSGCSVSGGDHFTFKKIDPGIMFRSSKFFPYTHAHVHVNRPECYENCVCRDDNTNYYKSIDCMKKYIEINPTTNSDKTLFASDADLVSCLSIILQRYEDSLKFCLCLKKPLQCGIVQMVRREGGLLETNLSELGLTGYVYKPDPREMTTFSIAKVEAIFKCSTPAIHNWRMYTRVVVARLYLVTMYPVHYKEYPRAPTEPWRIPLNHSLNTSYSDSGSQEKQSSLNGITDNNKTAPSASTPLPPVTEETASNPPPNAPGQGRSRYSKATPKKNTFYSTSSPSEKNSWREAATQSNSSPSRSAHAACNVNNGPNSSNQQPALYIPPHRMQQNNNAGTGSPQCKTRRSDPTK